MLVAAYGATVSQLTGRSMRDTELFEVWHHGTVSGTLESLIGRPPSTEEIDLHLSNVGDALSLLHPYAGVPEAVEAIAAKVPVAVFTSSSRAYAQRCLQSCGLDRFFFNDRLVANEDVARPKPNGEGLLLLCRRFQVAPRNVAYAGDAKNDMLAAEDAGLLAVAGRWGHYFTEDIPADVICDHPSDLVTLLSK